MAAKQRASSTSSPQLVCCACCNVHVEGVHKASASLRLVAEGGDLLQHCSMPFSLRFIGQVRKQS